MRGPSLVPAIFRAGSERHCPAPVINIQPFNFHTNTKSIHSYASLRFLILLQLVVNSPPHLPGFELREGHGCSNDECVYMGEGGSVMQPACAQSQRRHFFFVMNYLGARLALQLHLDFGFRRKWQPTPWFLPGQSQGRGSLVGCRLWGHTESNMTEAT